MKTVLASNAVATRSEVLYFDQLLTSLTSSCSTSIAPAMAKLVGAGGLPSRRIPTAWLSAPAHVGPYEVTTLIGAGWARCGARDTRLDRTVAIKVSQEQFTERFAREALAIATLNHPTSARCTTSAPITW